jgi:formamidopyrimidine-DNA glycosylase
VEAYRRLAATAALGRSVARVVAPDRWYVKGTSTPEGVAAAITGATVLAARRRGKLLLLDMGEDRPVLGLRFGMSGRLIVDGQAGVEQLLYAPAAVDDRYDRFALVFDDGGDLRVSDPRRLGGVELDPPEHLLGPDALGLTVPQLRDALSGARVALKARLLDQSRIAGIGNLIADETLWRSGLAPERPAGALRPAEVSRLQQALAETLELTMARGGSHTGDLMAQRHVGGRCPADGAPLRRSTVGGRTSWWCESHQR